MSEPLYDVVYAGEIIAPERQPVIEAFASLFKIPVATADRILSGSHRILKKGVSEAQAQLYVKKLSAIGMLVSIQPQVADPESMITLEPEAEVRSVSGVSVASGAGSRADADVEDDGGSADDEGNVDQNADDYPSLNAEQLSVEQQESSSSGSTNFAMVEDTSKVRRLAFKFTGNGTEFFRIWIVNVLLSIITLGIYSAWAKVRTNQYFYGNTWLDNASLEYLADPLAILKGRVIAVIFFIIYSLSQQFFPLLSPILGVLFLLAIPWLVSRSLRFRMRYTGYRNIRFGFEGNVWGAAKAYSLMFLLLPFTLGLLLPYMIFMQDRYLIENARYGVDHFSFNVSPREYYRIYVVAFFAMLAVAAVGALLTAATGVFGGIVVLAGYSLVVTYVKVETTNLKFDSTHLGDHQFSSSLEIWPYFQLYFVNALLVILTLGLFYPWARVRIARYRAECLLMMTQGSLNNYVGAQQEETSAIGEEVGDIFDVEIGF